MNSIISVNEITEDVKPVARQLIQQFDVYFDNVNLEAVKFLEVEYEKETSYFASCYPVNKMMQYFANCYYLIEIAMPMCATLTESQRNLVLLHELFHIPPNGTDPSDRDFLKMRKHNVQDFRVIVEEYGTLWMYDDDIDFLGKG